MKQLIFIPIFFLLLMLNQPGLAQQYSNEDPILPLKTNRSVLFGNDIVIHDQPERDQRNISICCAFNGWLYAVYSYNQPDQANISILKSTDNGLTWNVIIETGFDYYDCIIKKVNIMVCGNSIPNLKLFVGCVILDTLDGSSSGKVWRNKAEPYTPEEWVLNEGNINDLSLASDYMYPAGNSNPYSIATLYSSNGPIMDSLVFLSSGNGGLSFDNRQVVAITSKIFDKVALNYGRSPSYNSGRYFAAWEEQDNLNSNTGHIFTAHSEPLFNSPFTVPVCLDSLDPSAINKSRNPVISCQFNDVNNDSSNLTEVIMFEKYLPGTNSYDLQGYYNLQATNSNYFRNFSASPSQNYKIHPDINFNPYNSTFMMTYYDSTGNKLPFLTNDVNMTTPDSWNTITNGYNDNNNISAPHPKVNLNVIQHTGMNAWIAERPNGNGMALFDSPYSVYNGISEIKSIYARLIGSYPNPCTTNTTIRFELQKPEKVSVVLYSLIGQTLKISKEQIYPAGLHQLNFNISEFSQGTYMYTIRAGEYFASDKITIIR